MNDLQKITNVKLIKKFGAYPRDSIFQESQYIFNEINEKAQTPPIKLFSDEHQSDRRAFSNDMCILSHETISSKLRRDARNPLFAINRLHLLYCDANIR